MKQIWVILLGALAGLAQAQSVNWDATLASCSSQARVYEADFRKLSARSSLNYEIKVLSEKPLTVASLRERLAEHKEILESQREQIAYDLNACLITAAINQLQARSTTQSASRSSNSGPNMPEKNASRCIDYVTTDPGALRNTCNERVNLRWCSLSNNSNNRCGNNNLGWAEVAPGAVTYVDANVRSYVFACFSPANPSEVEFTPGRGLQAYCKR